MQTPSSETSYAIPVMTPQPSVVVLPNADDPKDRKMRDDNQLVGATHVADIVDTANDWDVPFFGCFSSIMPNCCMSTICPCVAIAQIQARLGNSYQTALLSHGSVIFGLVVCIILFISHSTTTDVVEQRSPTDGEPHPVDRSSEGRQIIFLCGAAFFLLFYAFSLCLVRMRVRKQFEIKGSVGVDCLVSTCCAPCAVAQMASQAQSYTPGSCSFQEPGLDTLPGYPITPMQFI
ncbi:PLAC8 family protein [Phytophthora cinnamomi]|uniref:PLAC8 family protein n=1 Tax=Phytophthora cinnamomi TaxID=4785 RepID=UPI0035594B72|nr:PLAC8 family protein [Phytophthora cinnamomi]